MSDKGAQGAPEFMKQMKGMAHFAFTYNVDPVESVQSSGELFCMIRGGDVRLCYEILSLGNRDHAEALRVVITPGGQRDLRQIRGFATHLVADAWNFHKVKVTVLVWDRRNMGLSSIAYGDLPLPVAESDDLYLLLKELQMAPVLLYGVSAGARIGIITSLRHPDMVLGNIISPPSGGEATANQLATSYYSQYIEVASEKGIAAVADTPYYKALLKNHEKHGIDSRATFMAIDPQQFISSMRCSGDYLLQYAHEPVLGATSAELRNTNVPHMCLHHGNLLDKLHSKETAAFVARVVGCEFLVARDRSTTFDALLRFAAGLHTRHTPFTPGSTTVASDLLTNCKLTYFPIPGRAEVTRLCLAFGGVKFVEERILSVADWAALKPSTPWGSMPVLTLSDGSQLAQQRAMARFVAKQVGLYPIDQLAAFRVDELFDVFEDLSASTNHKGQGMEKEAKEAARKADIEEGASAKLFAKIDAFVDANGSNGHAVGSSFTLADIVVFCYSCSFSSGFYDGVPSGAIERYSSIQGVRATVGAHPRIREWYADRGEEQGPEAHYIASAL
jgi:glutathione S-transferase